MTPAARLSAAVEVLTEIENRRRPATDALKDWGIAHRFAGSGDRAAIAGIVYDTLRRKASSQWIMGEATPRAAMLGMLRQERGLDPDAIARLCDGSRFAPSPLTETERDRLSAAHIEDAPAHIAGDYPEWLDGHFAAVFGNERAAEGAALARRAPIDLRINTLKSERAEAQQALAHLDAKPTPWSPLGLRVEIAHDARSPALQAEPAFLNGVFEIQDEGSQIAAALAAPDAGAQVVDLCAGGGGKTLALAAAMGNHGQVFATDLDLRRLAPIHARLSRAGVENVEVRTPVKGKPPIDDLRGRADLVVVDAPCTGTGAWRRHPDAKWRIRPGALAQRCADQARVLDEAARLLRPGGRLLYITCSVLHEENGAQIDAFLARHPQCGIDPLDESAMQRARLEPGLRDAALTSANGLLLTPKRTGTDGFFVSAIRLRPK